MSSSDLVEQTVCDDGGEQARGLRVSRTDMASPEQLITTYPGIAQQVLPCVALESVKGTTVRRNWVVPVLAGPPIVILMLLLPTFLVSLLGSYLRNAGTGLYQSWP